MTLTKGQIYDSQNLKFTGFTSGQTEGYNAWDYFDDQGRYLGPDANGIEPTFIVADMTDAVASDIASLERHLSRLGACQEARTWAKGRTAQQAWTDCEHPDWLLWWAARTTADKPAIVRVACAIARDVLHLTREEDRAVCLAAIEAAERRVNDPTEGNQRLARDAANAAYAAANTAYANAAYAAANAAYAATYAADAAYAAVAAANTAYANAAYATTYAAAYAANATYAAAAYAAAAYHQKRKAYCDLIRSILTMPEVRE